MLRKSLVVITATLLFSVGFMGQSSEVKTVSKPSFTFRIEVSCTNQTLKNEIESYLKRELRAVGDVKVVGKNDFAQYYLNLEVAYAAIGISQNLAIAYVLTENAYKWGFLKPYLSDKRIADLQKQMGDTEGIVPITERVFIHNKLVIYNPAWQKLPDVCKKIVIDYDVNLLEPIRESRQ